MRKSYIVIIILGFLFGFAWGGYLGLLISLPLSSLLIALVNNYSAAIKKKSTN